MITGAAGNGIGRSTALTLAREGAKVIVNYRTSRAAAETLVSKIAECGGEAICIQADIYEQSGCQKLISHAIERFGQVDICIIGPGGGWHPAGIEELDVAGTLEDLRHEVDPVVFLLPLLLPGMYAHKWGRIIGLGMHPQKISPAYAYNLGKAARLQALMLAAEQAWPHNVTVNVIAPGPMSPLDSLDEALEQSQHGQSWLNRVNISPQDVAEGIAFLCSESGRYITGCALPYLFNY